MLNSFVFRWSAISLFAAAFCASPALASGISECDSALVRNTDNSFTGTAIDYRLATLVTQDIWDQASHSGGASAVIYGVPVGSSYGDYKNSVSKALSSRKESLSFTETKQLAISKLAPDAATAYVACLKAVTRSKGLYLEIGKVTDDTADILVSYVGGNGTINLPVVLYWANGTVAVGSQEPRVLTAGASNIVTFIRPKTGSVVVHVNSLGGLTDSVEIAAPPPPPAPPPNLELVIHNIDDRFTASVAGNAAAVFVVGYGGQPGRWSLSQYLKPGLNTLNFVEEDLHPGGDGNPCWQYHYEINEIDPTGNRKQLRTGNAGSCGSGSTPPPSVPPEYIIF